MVVILILNYGCLNVSGFSIVQQVQQSPGEICVRPFIKKNWGRGNPDQLEVIRFMHFVHGASLTAQSLRITFTLYEVECIRTEWST